MTSLYFDFLQYSIDAVPFEAEHFSSMDWQGLYDFARKHSLQGVLFTGIERISKKIDVQRDIYLKCLGDSVSIKHRNRILNKEAVALNKQLEKDGFHCCILKGQGVAMLYPDPFVRTGGDIDVWIIPKGGKNARKSIINYLERDGQKTGLCYLHATLPPKNNIAVEYHFYPSFSYSPCVNKKLQNYFNKHARFNRIALPDDVGEISVPSLEFNLIFMLHHVYRHLFAEGIGLRQIIDYYYLLMQERTNPADIENNLKELGLLKFARAFMWVMKEVCALPEERMLVSPDAVEGQFVLEEILQSGNFGHTDVRFGTNANSRWGRMQRKVRRNFHLMSRYPSEALWQLPFLVWETLAIKLVHR